MKPGAIAAAAWLAAAAITSLLPDIDDFERTNLLADIMAAIGIALAILVGAMSIGMCIIIAAAVH